MRSQILSADKKNLNGILTSLESTSISARVKGSVEDCISLNFKGKLSEKRNQLFRNPEQIVPRLLNQWVTGVGAEQFVPFSEQFVPKLTETPEIACA